jgi:hypothetical protein
MQRVEDNNVWGMVSSTTMPMRQSQRHQSREVKSSSLNLPHHELISCLQERVNPQAEKKRAVDLYKFNNGAVPQQKPRTMMSLHQQSGKPTTLLTSKVDRVPTAYHHCYSQLSAELSSFKFGQSSVGCRFH